MRSVNKVILIGNLTRDPELRETPSGQKVATFGIATNRQWVTRDGQQNNSAEFHELVTWAKLAELAGKYLKKGKLVYVEGYLSTRSWETPEGIKKFKTEIVAQDIIILNRRNEKNEDVAVESAQAEETEEVAQEEPASEETTEETHEEEAAVDEKATEPETSEESTEETEEKVEAPEETPEGSEESIIDKDLGL